MTANEISHRPAKVWTKLSIRLSSEQADLVAGFLTTVTDIGIEYDAGFTPIADQPVEQVIAYIDDDGHRTQKLERVHAFLEQLAKHHPDLPKPVLRQELLEEKDWNAAWKAYFKPFSPIERLIIKPTWESLDQEDKLVLELDPGMAFGTGLHDSTRLCLQLIDTLYPIKGEGPASVLDVGCGTGILGMGCALLGAHQVTGIDNDPDAREAARHNIQVNNLQTAMTVPDLNLDGVNGSFDLVLANIIHDTLIELSADLANRLAPGSTLILAGILHGKQADNITQTFHSLGLKKTGYRESGEWCALSFAK